MLHSYASPARGGAWGDAHFFFTMRQHSAGVHDMRLKTTTRSFLLAGSALALLAACSEADIASIGDAGPVTVGDNTGTIAPGTATFNFVPTGGCPAGTTADTRSVPGATGELCVLDGAPGALTSDLSLAANAYAISGAFFVGDDNANSATLTIAPGSVLFGASGNDALFVSRGSDIDAQGTPSSPIIFTSANDLAGADANGDGTVTFAEITSAANDGSSNGDTDANEEWGGLVISGNAPINDCTDSAATGGTVDCVKSGEGGSGFFGGADADDGSGTLRYVRVQYAGFEFNGEDQLNGIAFQGVGRGTASDPSTFEFIQIHNNFDDGIEWFGGTANARYVVVTGAGDDSFDWTDGWQGNMQFGVVLQSNFRGDRGIEGDNRNNDNDLLPRSDPNFGNFTFIGGANADTGMVLRRGTAGNYFNGIITGFQDAGVDIDSDATSAQVTAGELTFNSMFVSGNAEDLETDGDSGDAATVTAFAAGTNNSTGTTVTLDGLFPGANEEAVVGFDASGLDSFLEATDFTGAFPDGTTSGSADDWTAGWTIGLPGECPEGTTLSTESVPAGRPEQRICVMTDITGNVTLTRGNLYQLSGAVFVGTDTGTGGSSATLTINPGVTIFGGSGNDALFVSRGSQIFANGTPGAPIIFTAREDVEGTVGADDNELWGGIVINGFAPINDCANSAATGGTVGCVKSGEGSSGLFGGADAEDDSGDLRYVRVQYAGFEFNGEDQLNGIAFQGVGSGPSDDLSEYEFIQVHNNFDDGIEWFGGTANARYVVITGAGDDALDWTDGWVGNVQYAIVSQTSPTRGDRGIEADNRNNDNDLLPRSNPTFSNFTFVGTAGGAKDTGMVLRRGTAGLYTNGIITGFPDAGIDIDDAATAALVATDELNFRSIYVNNNGSDLESDGDDGDAALVTAFGETGSNNVAGGANTLNTGTDVGISTAVVPGASEDAIVATDISGTNDFFDSVDYVGAVEDDADDWYIGWTFGL